MKTLKALWHWALNEQVKWDLFVSKAEDTLTPVARAALFTAFRLLAERRGWDVPFGWDDLNERGYAEYAEHIEKLSLAICEALEAMHGYVPEPTETSRGVEVLEAVGQMFAQSMAPFRGVGCDRPTLADVDTAIARDRKAEESCRIQQALAEGAEPATATLWYGSRMAGKTKFLREYAAQWVDAVPDNVFLHPAPGDAPPPKAEPMADTKPWYVSEIERRRQVARAYRRLAQELNWLS